MRKTKAEKQEPGKANGPVNRKAVVKEIVEDVYTSLPRLMKAMIAQAEGGNASMAKFLFEFAGVEAESEDVAAPPKDATEAILDLLLARKAESQAYVAAKAAGAAGEPGERVSAATLVR
jgi:hypothetical protein